MKKIIFTLAVTMLAVHLPAPIIQGVSPILTISTLDNVNLQIVAAGCPPKGQVVLETTTDLVNWTFISTNKAPNTGMVTNIVQNTNSIGFYRIHLQ
jgi:hypothetical protein